MVGWNRAEAIPDRPLGTKTLATLSRLVSHPSCRRYRACRGGSARRRPIVGGRGATPGGGGYRQGSVRRERDLSLVSRLGDQADDALRYAAECEGQAHHNGYLVEGVAERRRAATVEDGVQDRHPGHRR